MAELLLLEGPTLGVRWYPVNRRILERTEEVRSTSLGEVRVKTSTLPDGSTRPVPEFDDVQRLAVEHGLPLRDAQRRIQRDCE